MGHVLFLRKGSVHTAPGNGLPSGYQKLQYIQSSGTQYVDTGFKPKNTTKVTADFQVTTQPTDHRVIFGSRTNYSSADQFVLGFAGHNSPATWRADFGSNQAKFPSTVGWSSRFTAVFDSSACTLNTDSVNNTDTTFTSTHNLFLLANNDNETAAGNISANLYSCQIYDNGTLIRDYVPCKDPSGAVGLYDLTGEQFYGNSGTGVFYAGPPVVTLPEGYTQLMYLESSGTQYIDTGFKPNQDTRAIVDCQILSGHSANGQIISAVDSTNFYLLIYLYPSNVFSTRYGKGALQNFDSSISPFDRHVLDKNKNVTTIEGSVVTSTAATFSINYPLYLFARDNAGSVDNFCKMRLYSCRIYNNGLLVRDFIPCKNASGTVGLYDLVNGQFYTNAGTGTFTAGEVA